LQLWFSWEGIFQGGIIIQQYLLLLFLRGALSGSDLLPYMIFQIIGATLGALIGNIIAGGSVPIAPAPDTPLLSAILVEFLFTFALALTVLNVATAQGTKGNSFYGLAIGFTVMCGAFAGGGISGGAFNPAVGIALSLGALLNGTGGAWMLLYILVPLAGGALAALVFKLQGNEVAD
jgi:aquaporin Z